jgi:hypothetical protein
MAGNSFLSYNIQCVKISVAVMEEMEEMACVDPRGQKDRQGRQGQQGQQGQEDLAIAVKIPAYPIFVLIPLQAIVARQAAITSTKMKLS